MKIPTKHLGLFLLASFTIAAGAVDVGSRKQLFIDHRFIENDRGITLTMNPPLKAGQVVTGENPWEDGIISGGGTVIEDQGKYRMWYTSLPSVPGKMSDSNWELCYAESGDGVHWSKPALGVVEWPGTPSTNIVLAKTHVENGGGVFIDPKAPAEERYKLLAVLNEPPGSTVVAPDGWGMYMYASPDGLHWRMQPKCVFPFVPDSVNVALYDDRTGKYLAYVRTWVDKTRRVGVVVADDIMKPWPYDHSQVVDRKRDFSLHANRPGRMPPSREVPDAFGVDSEDPPNLDHYTSAVVKYPWAEDAYLMFPSAYLLFPHSVRRNDGPLDIELAVSRDGLKFERISRRPYIGLGPRGTGDAGSQYMYVGMLRRGQEILQYYGGFAYTHAGDQGLEKKTVEGGVFLVRQRLDGFVSADADHHGGEFVTPPLVFAGQRLELNMDASATGTVQVELRDADGRPIEGRTFADSDVLYQNDVAKAVTWHNGENGVGRWAGQPLRVAFRLRSAKLYAFQFVP